MCTEVRGWNALYKYLREYLPPLHEMTLRRIVSYIAADRAIYYYDVKTYEAPGRCSLIRSAGGTGSRTASFLVVVTRDTHFSL